MPKKLVKVSVFVKLGLSRKSVDEKITQGNAICKAMANNVQLFPNPFPSISDLQQATDNLLLASNAAVNKGLAETNKLISVEAAYDMLATRMGVYVQRIARTMANGALAARVVHAAGMETRKTPAPTPAPEAISRLWARFTNQAGLIKVTWKGTRYVKYYKLFISTDMKNWSELTTTTRLSAMVDGLQSNLRYHFRIIAVGTRGRSEPSAAVSTIAA